MSAKRLHPLEEERLYWLQQDEAESIRRLEARKRGEREVELDGDWTNFLPVLPGQPLPFYFEEKSTFFRDKKKSREAFEKAYAVYLKDLERQKQFDAPTLKRIQLELDIDLLSDDDRVAALFKAEDNLKDISNCEALALAINKVLFNDKAEIVMAVNRFLWLDRQHVVGRIGVRDPNGIIWDESGKYYEYENFLCYGTVDLYPGRRNYRYLNQEQALETLLLDGPNALLAAKHLKSPSWRPDIVQILRNALNEV